jgi:hypothetical protein
MPQDKFTSIYLPNSPVPEPPDWRPFFYSVLQIIFVIFFVLLIGFLIFETAMDIIGKPIWVGGIDIVKQQTTPPTKEEIATQFTLISPLPNSQINNNRVTIICTWQPDIFTQLNSRGDLLPPYVPELFVDGNRVVWEVEYESSWFAQVNLKSGLHNIQVGATTAEFLVELPNNTTTKTQNKNNTRNDNDYQLKRLLWQVSRSHSFVGDLDKCKLCHEIIDENITAKTPTLRTILKPVNNSKSCINCHDKEKINLTHNNKLDIWDCCSKCHTLHGTTTDKKGLLKKDFLPSMLKPF